MSKSRAPSCLKPHFCVIQAEELGFTGWRAPRVRRGEEPEASRRWDVLLEALQKFLAVDGWWGGDDVKASLFVGADAIHLTGEAQSSAMPVFQGRTRFVSAPCTVQTWETMLWRNYLQDQPGLRWEVGGAVSSRCEAQRRLLGRLEELMAHAPATSVVLAFTPLGGQGNSYEILKLNGMRQELTGATHVYLLTGGAHGFDFQRDADGSFFSSVMACCARKLGPSRVFPVSLCCSGHSGSHLATASFAAYLRVEHACGGLDLAVAGLTVCAGPWMELVQHHGEGDAAWGNFSDDGTPPELEAEDEHGFLPPATGAATEDGPGSPSEERADVQESEDLACKLKLRSLLGTWRDRGGSTYDVVEGETSELVMVKITRSGAKSSRNKRSVAFGRVDGMRGPQIIWGSGSYYVSSPLPEGEGVTPEMVEWRRSDGRKGSFTWNRVVRAAGAARCKARGSRSGREHL